MYWGMRRLTSIFTAGIEEVDERNIDAAARDRPRARVDQAIEGDAGMTEHKDDVELVRGSGNIFADFDPADANVRQLRAILAAEVVKTLEEEKLSVRDAEGRTGIAAADFSRIRQVKLDRFTVDRLMRILDRLDRDVRVKVSVAARPEHLAA